MENQKEKKNQNPGGRPNLADAEVLAHRLVTRINTKDNQALLRDFKVWQSSRTGRIADFLREIILTRNTPNQQAAKNSDTEKIIELTQTLYTIRQHLKHIDTNYNQIARRINSIEHTGKLSYEVQSSKATINKIEPILAQIDALVKAQTEGVFIR